MRGAGILQWREIILSQEIIEEIAVFTTIYFVIARPDLFLLLYMFHLCKKLAAEDGSSMTTSITHCALAECLLHCIIIIRNYA